MSNRGEVAGLLSRQPIATTLPAIYQEDEFTQRFTAGLDEVLAPVLSTLDNLTAYLDPALAPEDFVEWLASWVGLVVDENWSVERKRRLVAQTVELYSARGTARGLAALVELYTGERPEVEDSGGASWSATPNGPFPGRAEPSLKLTVRASADIDEVRLRALVAAAVPAHVAHTVEVVGQ